MKHLQISGEAIKSAISLKIYNSFKNATVYKEFAAQNIEKPCFFVTVLNVDQHKQSRQTYNRNYLMQVQYHSRDNDLKKYEHLANIGNRLFKYLTEIEVPIFLGSTRKGKFKLDSLPVFGKQLNFQIVEGILQFFVTYAVRVKSVVVGDGEMQDLELTETILK